MKICIVYLSGILIIGISSLSLGTIFFEVDEISNSFVSLGSTAVSLFLSGLPFSKIVTLNKNIKHVQLLKNRLEVCLSDEFMSKKKLKRLQDGIYEVVKLLN